MNVIEDQIFNNILWSKGPINNNYSKKSTFSTSNEFEIIDQILLNKKFVWIRLGSSEDINDLNIFSENLDKLKKPIILITSDGDRLVPSSYSRDVTNRILNNKNIINWYTQNYDRSIIHTKLKHYPIGFDFHTSKWLINSSKQDKIKFMINSRNQSPVNNRIKNRILSDTHNSKSHKDREDLYNTLMNNKDIIFTRGRLTFEKITQEYNKYNFVLSPKGKGLDCHRTWELFLAGVIVITKTSPLDEMYRNKNLPIIIINDWNELNIDLEKKLNDWYHQYKELTCLENIIPKLLFNYWLT